MLTTGLGVIQRNVTPMPLTEKWISPKNMSQRDCLGHLERFSDIRAKDNWLMSEQYESIGTPTLKAEFTVLPLLNVEFTDLISQTATA